MNKINLVSAAFFLFVAATTARSNDVQVIDEADIKLAIAKPLESKVINLLGNERKILPDEVDAVSEGIAQSLITQLKTRGKKGNEFADSLRACSAIHASKMRGNNSACLDDYSGEANLACLIKRGYGQKSVGQVLAADRFDLNSDGIADYIISDRYYCHELSANQANVYFVMLSSAKADFRLSYADWASYGIDVVEHPVSGEKVLIERAPKTYGIYSRIMKLTNGEYVPRTCILQDKHGYARCDGR